MEIKSETQMEKLNKQKHIRIKDIIMSVLIIALIAISIIIYVKSKKDYDLLETMLEEKENDRLTAVEQYNDLIANHLKEKSEAKKELEEELSSVKEEYSNYKANMQEYEGLAKAEAEARKAEAESVLKAEAEAEAEKQSAELESKQEEERRGYETGITYEQLARTPDDYENKKIKFTGKVVQLIESTNSDTISIRFAVDSDYDKILFCQYDKSIIPARILEDDIITIYGVSMGLYSYQSTLSGTITIPSALIDKIEQ